MYFYCELQMEPIPVTICPVRMMEPVLAQWTERQARLRAPVVLVSLAPSAKTVHAAFILYTRNHNVLLPNVLFFLQTLTSARVIRA